jgi:CMD domain protein
MMTSAAESTAGPGAGAGQDVIDQLAGIAPGSRLAELRAQRPDVVRYAQGSYEALLEPADLGGVSRREREAVALRVAVLTPSPALVAWHSARLQELAGEELVRAVVEQGAEGAGLSAREAAILRHADLLATAPGAATPANVAALKEAGLTPRDIVTISQLIAFVSFQARVLAALRLFAEEA